MRLVTLPGVFRPRSDSWMLAAEVAAVAPGARVLDLCTGSGVVAVSAAVAGASEVVAVDVSRRAVLTAVLNARRHGVRVRGRRGDLWAAVPGERFDVIAANPPYVPGPATPARGAARAWEGGPDGRNVLDRVIVGAAAHLCPGGLLLVAQSSLCGNAATLAAMEAAGLRAALCRTAQGPLGPIVRARVAALTEAGLLAPGVDHEVVAVIRGAA